jgi:hypothetical protein
MGNKEYFNHLAKNHKQRTKTISEPVKSLADDLSTVGAVFTTQMESILKPLPPQARESILSITLQGILLQLTNDFDEAFRVSKKLLESLAEDEKEWIKNG